MLLTPITVFSPSLHLTCLSNFHRNMERRQKYTPTTLAERARIVWMWVDGVSTRIIAQEMGTSVTTVCRWIRRWQREGEVNTRYRRSSCRAGTGAETTLFQCARPPIGCSFTQNNESSEQYSKIYRIKQLNTTLNHLITSLEVQPYKEDSA